jgi:hypothetical protein
MRIIRDLAILYIIGKHVFFFIFPVQIKQFKNAQGGIEKPEEHGCL